MDGGQRSGFCRSEYRTDHRCFGRQSCRQPDCRNYINYNRINDIANGATFWILGFLDLNATGADDGLAIDNFSIVARRI